MKIKFIGNIINQLRTENDLSVAELAKRSGVSADRIEMIESGEAMPSISSMIRLARALGARLGTLLDGQESSEAVITRAAQIEQVGRSAQTSEASANRQLDFCSLAQGMKDRSMEPMIVALAADQPHTEINADHDGEEFIYVLDGVVEVRYKDEIYLLSAGDSIYYNSSAAHSIASKSQGGARVLIVIYTP